MFVQHEQVVKSEFAPEAPAEEGVEPPKEGSTVDAACGFWRIHLVLGAQNSAFVDRLHPENEGLRHDRGDRNAGNGSTKIIPSTEPERPGMGDVKQKGNKQEGIKNGRRPDGSGVFGV